MKKIFEGFMNYHKLLIIGFIGGLTVWIFSFTFESLLPQNRNFWIIFGGSLLVSIVWYFILSIPLFFILKFFGINFNKDKF
jgi:hypothetical protein